MMRTTVILGIVGFAAALLAMPQDPSAPVERRGLFERSDTPIPADTYCKINGFPILRTEYGDWLQKHKGDAYIRDYVIAKLIRDAAKNAGAEAKPEEVEQLVNKKIEEKIINSYRGRRELFIERELTWMGKTMEQLKLEMSWEVENDILAQKTMKARRLTTDSDVEREFYRLYGKSGRQLNLRAILIELDVPSVTSHKPIEEIQRMTAQAIDEGRRKGVDIVKRLQSGALDFASAARAYSDDARSKLVGGDIGAYIVSPPEFGEDFDAALQKAKIGQIVGPIRIQQGFVIAEITKEVAHDLRKEKETIRKNLTEREAAFDEVQGFINELLVKAKLVR
jgi:parvulin-like peptidyl-prolyl isomerase